jgi:hypothetical protein
MFAAVHLIAAPESTSAGIATAVASVITALGLLIGSFAVLLPQIRRAGVALATVGDTLADHKLSIDAATAVARTGVEETTAVHQLVNQRMTDMLRYQAALVTAMESAGIPVPIDQSLLDVERRRPS